MKTNSDVLVIGDIHLQDKYPGYLTNQCETIKLIVKQNPAKYIVFLGDVFHKRSPSPIELLSTQKLFAELHELAAKNNSQIHVIMGNHDAQSKADDGITALSLFTENITLHNDINTLVSKDYSFCFVPHYENEDKIVDNFHLMKDSKWIFGHFGFNGCLNSTGNYDFSINPDDIPSNAILGHIHEYRKYTNNEKTITILGTPYQTDFLGQDLKRYVGLISNDTLTLKEINIGPKYITCDLANLQNKLAKTNSSQYIIVRLYIDKFIVENVRDLRKQLMEEHPQIAYLDIRFTPELKDKSAQSNYAPKANLVSINEMIILDYLDEKAAKIPKDELLEGLKKINENKPS